MYLLKFKNMLGYYGNKHLVYVHSTRVPPFNSTSCVTAQQSVVVIFEKIRKNVSGGSCSG